MRKEPDIAPPSALDEGLEPKQRQPDMRIDHRHSHGPQLHVHHHHHRHEGHGHHGIEREREAGGIEREREREAARNYRKPGDPDSTPRDRNYSTPIKSRR